MIIDSNLLTYLICFLDPTNIPGDEGDGLFLSSASMVLLLLAPAYTFNFIHVRGDGVSRPYDGYIFLGAVLLIPSVLFCAPYLPNCHSAYCSFSSTAVDSQFLLGLSPWTLDCAPLQLSCFFPFSNISMFLSLSSTRTSGG